MAGNSKWVRRDVCTRMTPRAGEKWLHKVSISTGFAGLKTVICRANISLRLASQLATVLSRISNLFLRFFPVVCSSRRCVDFKDGDTRFRSSGKQFQDSRRHAHTRRSCRKAVSGGSLELSRFREYQPLCVAFFFTSGISLITHKSYSLLKLILSFIFHIFYNIIDDILNFPTF